MSDLENAIRQEQTTIKRYTYHWLINEKEPFEYMKRISEVGERKYQVNKRKSFEYGVNKCLDKYNKKGRVDLASKFYALKHGAEAIIRYVNHHRKKNYDADN